MVSSNTIKPLRIHSKAKMPEVLSFLPESYDQLSRLARNYLAGQSHGHMLETSALLNEAILKLLNPAHPQHWRDQNHFVAVVATCMRNLLIDHARKEKAQKRGGKTVHVPLDSIEDLPTPDVETDDQLLALDAALTKLASIDPLKSRLLEMRIFGEMTIEATAEALDISPATVKRHWTLACAWLKREIHS
jgi:RNA polymerase sigma factor (TIGR02999 family)